CDPDERCAPCISPVDQMPTGACDIKGECLGAPSQPTVDAGPAAPTVCPYLGPPVIDPSTLPACAADAHCFAAALVPDAERAQLAPCGDPSQLCVPDLFLTTGGNFIPATCRSINDSEGRCLSQAIPQVASQAAELPPSTTCGVDEACVPCYN